jgi:hypothetical protein
VERERVEEGAVLEQCQRRRGDVVADEGGEGRALLVGVAPQAERGRHRGGGEARDRDPHVSLGERLASVGMVAKIPLSDVTSNDVTLNDDVYWSRECTVL